MGDLRDAARRGDSDAVRAALAAIDAEVEADRAARDAEAFPQFVRGVPPFVRGVDALRIRLSRWAGVGVGLGTIGVDMGGGGADAALTAEQWRELAVECERQARFVDDRDGTTPINNLLIDFSAAVRRGDPSALGMINQIDRRLPEGDPRREPVRRMWELFAPMVTDGNR